MAHFFRPSYDAALTSRAGAMTSFDLPADEIARLQSLHALKLLDTLPEERFDKIVRYAAKQFNVPIALISLVDSERQWFKAKVGLELCGSSREASICSHVIQLPGVFSVADLTRDERFANNPFVTNPPYIRSYIGAPLILSSGHAIGALCLIDLKPRKYTGFESVSLQTLAMLTIEEIEKRRERK